MRRADRLFQILQIMRGKELITAAELAAELEVSERTIYRDVRDLMASGVPIEGEAGVGYVLAPSFDLPPLMFTPDEIEALVLGSRVVEQWADPDLARAARSVIRKVGAAVPEDLKERIESSPLYSVSFTSVGPHLTVLREAISSRRKVRFRYRRADETESERTVHPICLTLMMSAWLLVAWCEQRDDFRTFRLDRMDSLDLLDETFEEDDERSVESFLAALASRRRQSE